MIVARQDMLHAQQQKISKRISVGGAGGFRVCGVQFNRH